MSKQVTAGRRPVKKVAAAGAAGGGAALVIWVASQFGVEMPVEVANSIVALAAFVAGYMKRN